MYHDQGHDQDHDQGHDHDLDHDLDHDKQHLCARPPAWRPTVFFPNKSVYKFNNAYLCEKGTFICFSKKTDKVCPPFSPPPPHHPGSPPSQVQ